MRALALWLSLFDFDWGDRLWCWPHTVGFEFGGLPGQGRVEQSNQTGRTGHQHHRLGRAYHFDFGCPRYDGSGIEEAGVETERSLTTRTVVVEKLSMAERLVVEVASVQRQR